MIKKLFFITLLSALTLTSCLNPGETPDNMKPRAAAAFLQESEDGEKIFITDDGIVMYPDMPVAAPDSMLGRRYFVEFLLESQTSTRFDITLRSIQEMIVEGVTKGEPTGASQPVIPATVWAYGDYLNMVLNVKTDPRPNFKFTLFDKGSAEEPNFVLRYDPKTNQPASARRVALSFDISSYREALTVDSILVPISINIENTGVVESRIKITKK